MVGLKTWLFSYAYAYEALLVILIVGAPYTILLIDWLIDWCVCVCVYVRTCVSDNYAPAVLSLICYISKDTKLICRWLGWARFGLSFHLKMATIYLPFEPIQQVFFHKYSEAFWQSYVFTVYDLLLWGKRWSWCLFWRHWKVFIGTFSKGSW